MLQKEVRALKAELRAVTSHGVAKSADAEIQQLRTESVAFNSCFTFMSVLTFPFNVKEADLKFLHALPLS